MFDLLAIYRKAILNHLLSLFPSYVVKQSILFGKEMPNVSCVKSDAKPSGVKYNKQNLHQLLHRIASVWTSLIYNK